MVDRTCNQCGTQFEGYYNSKFCSPCAKERKRAQSREGMRRWNKAHPGNWRNRKPMPQEKVKLYAKRCAEKKKTTVVEHYSDGSNQCCGCGFNNIKALTIDHVNGGGSQHRKEDRIFNLYHWLIKNDFPEGFQVLCMNCQFIKRLDNGECKRENWNKSQ